MTTNHIITLSLDLDTNRVEEIIRNQAAKQIIEYMQKNIESSLFDHRGWGSDLSDPKYRTGYSDFVAEHFKKFLEDNKEEIIDRAAKQLSDSTKKSKKFKEKFAQIVEDA